jgi:hypothetical protein
MHLLLRESRDLDIASPVPVKSAASFLEPGLIGIFRPVILLPEGLARNLTAAELDAVLAHELSHLARRDNLTAALHMLVETVFWFHPLVWWIGSRLVEERERACDENVLACGNPPLVYAESILKVCRYYIQTPLACASGMSGPDLNVRLTAIMTGGVRDELSPRASLFLAMTGAAALMLPISAGMLGTMPVTHIARRVENALNIALPVPAPVLQLAPETPAPRPVHRTVAARPPVTTAVAVAPPSIPAAPAQAAQGAVIVTYVSPAVPAIPPIVEEMQCRRPEILPGSRLPGPTVCKPQSEWAALRAKGLDVAPDGSIYGLSDFEKERSLNARTCSSVGAGSASNAYRMLPNCF